MPFLSKNFKNCFILAAWLSATIFATSQFFATTNLGLGLTSDSIHYIQYARSIAENKTLSGFGNHWPPLYPIFLAASSFINHDLLTVAKWDHVAILVINIFLFGFIVYSSTEKKILPTVIAFFILAASQVLLEIHGMAWSEPLFLMFSLVGIYLLSLYLKQSNKYLLLLSAVFVGLSVVTRYAGVAFALSGSFSILVLGSQSRKKRIFDSTIFLMICLIPLSLWIGSSFVTNNSHDPYPFVFNSIVKEELLDGAKQILIWLLLPINKTYLLLLFFSAVALLLRVSVKSSENNPTYRLCELCFISIVIYILFLLFSKLFFRADMPFDRRILAPFYYFLLLGLLLLAHRLSTLNSFRWLGYLVFIYLIAIASFELITQYKWVESSKNGVLFARKSWVESGTLRWLRENSIDSIVYTNGPGPISIYTTAKSRMIPRHTFTDSREQNENFNQEINTMVNNLINHNGYLVYFSDITWRWYLPTEELLVDGLPLKLVYKAKDGAIYKIDESNNENEAYTLSDGSQYTGEWKNNKPHGRGTKIFPNGDKFVGEFRGGFYFQGTYTFSNGSIYRGQFENGVLHGKGFQSDIYGNEYEGDFKNGIRFGSGKYKFSDGSQYKGEWKNDLPNGMGEKTTPNGDKFAGEFKDGGYFQGTYTFSGGAQYQGKFKNGVPHGQGTLKYSNGSQYVGEFKEGMKHGQGILTSFDGKEYEGEWKDDKFVLAPTP